jgi:hypothetical protein
MRQSYTTVLERNTTWAGAWATEPYEAAWAGEALFFIRALEAAGELGGAVGRVQISPDGLHWVDEGTQIALSEPPATTFARVRHFGGWLRLAGELPAGATLKVLAYLALKE